MNPDAIVALTVLGLVIVLSWFERRAARRDRVAQHELREDIHQWLEHVDRTTER